MTKKQIVIFGSSGFIGKYLKDKFGNDASLEVQGYSSQTCDLLSATDVRKVFASLGKEDSVIIVSSITRVKENSFSAMIKNIQMIENCCQALSENPVGHVCFFSTITVYGMRRKEKGKLHESMLPVPDDYYSISKITSEYLLKTVCRAKSIPLTIMRLPGIYGFNDRFVSAVGQMVKCALKDNEIVVFDKGDDIRDYVYVDDVFKLVNFAITKKKEVLINVGTGKSFTIKEIAECIKNVISHSIEIVYREKNKDAEERDKSLEFDCTVRERAFQDVLMTDLKAGVRSYIEHLSIIDAFK